MDSNQIRNTNSLKILDCTLRDGGYYNNWDFDNQLISEHLVVLSDIGVDIVEVGFRSLINNSYKGPLAFSRDDFLDSFDCHQLKIAVMINVKEFEESNNIKSDIDNLFPLNKFNSKVDIVRLACNYNELEKAKIIYSILKEKEYEVCINIMQGAFINNDILKNIIKQIKGISISAIYLADSTGSMDSIEYNSKLKVLAEETGLEIGIHAHNNLGKALDNTLESINIGCKWLDATILGMGRGPGNVDIEELLISLTPKYKKNLNLIPLINHSEKWFNRLKEKYKWGKNRFYFLSGKFKIHPSYVQEMISDSRYSNVEIIGAIDYLKKDNARLFNSNKLIKARSFFEGTPRGKTKPRDVIQENTILILGNSDGIENFKTSLEKIIIEMNMYVIAINSKSKVNPDLINARVFSHPMRLLADNDLFQSMNKLIITPFSMLPEKIKKKLINNTVLDYGLQITNNTLNSLDYYCNIPSPIALAYALGTLGSTDVKNILLAGFEGYQKGDERNIEIENLFKNFYEIYKNINLYSITPTNYMNIDCKSIYGLNL